VRDREEITCLSHLLLCLAPNLHFVILYLMNLTITDFFLHLVVFTTL
jgi:hypothetical protein